MEQILAVDKTWVHGLKSEIKDESEHWKHAESLLQKKGPVDSSRWQSNGAKFSVGRRRLASGLSLERRTVTTEYYAVIWRRSCESVKHKPPGMLR